MRNENRIKDPKQTRVQLNLQVPWQFREDLSEIAQERHISLAELVRRGLETAYEKELVMLGRGHTTDAGATS